jgi:hypothetical protein
MEVCDFCLFQWETITASDAADRLRRAAAGLATLLVETHTRARAGDLRR